MKKFLRITLVILGIIILAPTIFIIYQINQTAWCGTDVEVIDFESCIAAGNPAMESHPRQCRDPSYDETFVEVIEERFFCTPESRNADACITLYQPVCGWNDPERIQCITFPCANTFSNSCEACKNPDTLYYTEGECPTE